MPNSQTFEMILIMAAITFFIRGLPFLLFHGNKKTPAYIIYLGKVLPYALIGLLVIYCFKDVSPLASPYAMPEIIATAAIIFLHAWKRNTLLSIGGGTAFYMFLSQVIFWDNSYKMDI